MSNSISRGQSVPRTYSPNLSHLPFDELEEKINDNTQKSFDFLNELASSISLSRIEEPNAFEKLQKQNTDYLYLGDSLTPIPQALLGSFLNIKDQINLKQVSKNLNTSISGDFELQEKITILELRQLQKRGVAQDGDSKPLGFLLSLMKNLKSLDLSDIQEQEISEIRESLKFLKKLTQIKISHPNIENVDFLADVEGLRLLDLSGCSSLKQLPIFKENSPLKVLNLTNCYNIDSLKPLQNCRNLGSLILNRMGAQDFQQISSSARLTSLAGIENCRKLRYLNLSDCRGLTSLQGLDNCRELLILDLANASRLCTIEEIRGLIKLTYLDLKKCEGLKSIEPLGSCISLEYLNLDSYSGDIFSNTMENLKNLTFLCLPLCKNFKSIEQVSGCISLQTLDLSFSFELTSLKGIQNLTKLTCLDLSSCQNLKCIKEVGSCSSLKTLNLTMCKELVSLNGIQSLVNLTDLHLMSCHSLKSVEEVGGCLSLILLNALFCTSLLTLKGVGNCKALKRLTIDGCRKLASLEGLEELEGLEGFSTALFSVCKWEIDDVRRTHPRLRRSIPHRDDWLFFIWSNTTYALRKLKKMMLRFFLRLQGLWS